MRNMSRESLEKLATNRLLEIKRRLNSSYCVGSWWLCYDECSHEACIRERKELEECNSYLNLIKSILNTREHIKRKTRNRRALEPYIGRCPKCGAKHGQKCTKGWRVKVPRGFVHKERLNAR